MATLYHLYDPKVQKANYPPHKLNIFNYKMSNNMQIATKLDINESEQKLQSKQIII